MALQVICCRPQQLMTLLWYSIMLHGVCTPAVQRRSLKQWHSNIMMRRVDGLYCSLQCVCLSYVILPLIVKVYLHLLFCTFVLDRKSILCHFPPIVSDRMVPPTRFRYKVLLAYSVCLFVGPLLCYQLLGRRVQ